MPLVTLITKENKKEGETISDNEMIWSFYVFMFLCFMLLCFQETSFLKPSFSVNGTQAKREENWIHPFLGLIIKSSMPSLSL